MKKIMIMALLALDATTAFAGDSEPLKAIMKANDFAKAQELVKSSLSQLPNDEEKAKAYNKLVELAMSKVEKEQTIITQNQLAEQLKQGKVEPFDTVGYYAAIYNAIANAIECDRYDQMPNSKGKVKPRFHNANQSKLYSLRPNLINGGQEAAQKQDQQIALNYFGLYAESATAPLFKEVDRTKNPDTYVGEVARVASVYAFQDKNMELANKYADIALADTATYNAALDLKVYYMQQGLKTHVDSLQFVSKLQDLYVKNPNSDQIFSTLVTLYGSLDQKTKMDRLISEKITQDPNNFTAWALKGQAEMNAQKWDDAITSFKKAIGIDTKNSLVLTYLGFCINTKAQGLNNLQEQKKLYTESMGYLEKAKNVDPNREKANWSYPLYQCYYNLYGQNDSRTKEMESMNK